MLTDRDLLISTYNAFNVRDIDTFLAVMHPDVDLAERLDFWFLYRGLAPHKHTPVPGVHHSGRGDGVPLRVTAR
jgi:hypothetical protein